MDLPERPLLEQQLADFAALKAVSELRQSLPRGHPNGCGRFVRKTG